MTSSERRALIPLLKRVLNDTITHGTKSTARYWLHRLQKPRSKPARARKEAKAAQHREETGRVYRAVMGRGDPSLCECGCDLRTSRWGGEMDHFYGRGVPQTEKNCWRLTTHCHRQKTENRPSRDFWDSLFRVHCDKYDYPFKARLVKGAA